MSICSVGGCWSLGVLILLGVPGSGSVDLSPKVTFAFATLIRALASLNVPLPVPLQGHPESSTLRLRRPADTCSGCFVSFYFDF